MKRERNYLCGYPLHRYIAATDVIEASNVNGINFYRWLRRKGYRKCPFSGVIGRKLFVRNDIADEYLAGRGAPRMDRRPKGWLSREQAIERSGYSAQWWDRHIRKGDVRAVRWNRIIFVHPHDVEEARRRREARKAPVDWVMLSELAKRHGVSRVALKERARRLGIRWRIYDHPKSLSDAAYVHESDVPLLLDSGIDRAPPLGWVPYTRLAREHGVNPKMPWEWFKRHGYEVVYAMHQDGNRAGWCSLEAWEAYKRASYKLAGRGRGAS